MISAAVWISFLLLVKTAFRLSTRSPANLKTMPRQCFHMLYSAQQHKDLTKALFTFKMSCGFTVQISPIRGLEWPRGFQEVKAPRFHDNGRGWW